MFESPWQIGFVLGIAGLYALFLYRFIRERLSRTASTPHTPIEPGEKSQIVCPECGTRNVVGYRFCRSCIAELPRAGDADQPSGQKLSRYIR